MSWAYGIGIVATLCFSFICIPWRWLTHKLLSASFVVGDRCYRYAPQQWQLAWQTLSCLQHRLTALLLLVSLGTLLSAAFPGQVDGIFIVMTLLCALGLVLPLLRAQRRMQSRQAKLIAALPAQLDLLGMLLVAGQPLLISLQQSSDSGIDNPLREELRNIVSMVRAGVSVDEAFARLLTRYPCRELRLFCNALHHARESGAGLASILYEQAEQRRQELFLRAEKKAMEAPVKLMFPLMMFIFPGTLLVLVVTLTAKMMWSL